MNIIENMNRNIVYITIEGIFFKESVEESYKEKFILNSSCFTISHSTYINDEKIPFNWIDEYEYILERYAGYSCWDKIIDLIEKIIDSKNECTSKESITISIQHDYFAKDIEIHHVPKESVKEVFKEIRFSLPNLENIPILLQDD